MKLQPGIAISPRKTNFGPIMFSGRLNEGLKDLNQAGFHFVELSLRTVEDVDADELNKKLSDLDINVTAVATGQAFLFDGLSLGSDDRSIREKAIEHFNKMTVFAKKINAGQMILGGMRGNLAGTGDEFKKNFENGLAAIRTVAEFTDKNDIPLAFEPINRYETNWIHTLQEGCDFLDKIGIDSAKLLIDTFHMNIEEANMAAAIKSAGKKVGYVHFADNTRYPPGQGAINYRKVLDALDSINYSGPVVTEALPLPDDNTAVLNTAKFWQDMSIAL